MSKPIARFSPLPSFGVALFSFCCRQIKTSSSTFLTSNTYYRDDEVRLNPIEMSIRLLLIHINRSVLGTSLRINKSMDVPLTKSCDCTKFFSG